MKTELEKKYNFTSEDYEIIKEKCEFIEEVNLKDYYLDKDFILSKNEYYLRLRNGEYELKKCSMNPETKLLTSEEYIGEEKINKEIVKFNITIDDLIGTIFIDTKRQKFKYNYKGYNILIDVEEYQYGQRYEIELIYSENNDSEERNKFENKLNNIINDFRKEIGLTSLIMNKGESKLAVTSMHQNIELYEILMGNEI